MIGKSIVTRHAQRMAGVLVLLAAVSLEAQQGGGGRGGASVPGDAGALPDTTAITPAMIAKGRKIYHGKGACIVCHGEKMEGTAIAPPHRKASGWKDAKDGAFPELFRVITTGVPNTVMVRLPNGITTDDALQLASFIWAVNHRGESP